MTKFNYEASYANIAAATREQAVQTEIIGALQHVFQQPTSYDHDTDGVMLLDPEKNKYLLCEFKLDVDFSNAVERAKVILQSVFYLAKLEKKNGLYPAVLLVADKNEFFILQTNRLNYYLSMELDWERAASTAHERHPNVVKAIAEDESLRDRIYIHQLNSAEDLEDLVNAVFTASLIERKIRISKYNIHPVFDDFKERVLKDWRSIGANKAVNIFMSCFLDPDNNDLHRRNRDIFLWFNPMTKQDERVEVNGDLFDQFWSHFDQENYTISEKQRLVAMSDEIIEETNRRFKGEYYTPALWVDEAHKEMSKVYGENWKDEYVVWDCACGTGNLTRNYRFKELYMSTLNEEDLSQAVYGNERATLFQYDFLNDGEDKLPEGLRKALKDGKVIFLINPPYATSTTLTTIYNKEGKVDHKKGVAAHSTHAGMTADDLGRSKEQLYAHFLYKIGKMKEQNDNIGLGLFSPISFLTTASFNKFRKFFLERMTFNYGMVFKASHFADVSDSWGIGFTVWGK